MLVVPITTDDATATDDGHSRAGALLLKEEEDRHRFWLLASCILPGERRFLRRCERFDEKARRQHRPTLNAMKASSVVPSD